MSRKRTQPLICTADGCGRATYARGLCHMHYIRLLRTGTTDPRPRAGKRRLIIEYRKGVRSEVLE